MRKPIALLICALLGVAAGYLAAPPATMAYVQTTEPDMFGAFLLSVIDSSVACDCKNQPLSENLQTVSNDLEMLQHWRIQNPDSLQLKQEIGLVEVHLSRLCDTFGRQDQAGKEMKQAQAELIALGWKNVSPAHLIALTKRLDSEYSNSDQPSQAASPRKSQSAH